jgi:hypothetical protein
MADLKITELASKNISLSDFMIKADSNGLMTKNTVENLSNVLNTVGEVGFKGSVASTDATVGSDGWYFAEDSGTYTNNGGLVIDLSNNLAIIIVSNTQTTFSKIDIPLNIAFDATPTSGSTKAVTSDGVFDEFNLTNKRVTSQLSEASEMIALNSIIDNRYLSTTGVLTTNNDYKVNKYQVTAGKTILIKGLIDASSDMLVYAFGTTNATTTIISGTIEPQSAGVNSNYYKIVAPATATYLFVNSDKINNQYVGIGLAAKLIDNQRINNIAIKQQLSEGVNIINSDAASNGNYLNTAGALVSNSGYNVLKFPVTAGKEIIISGLINVLDVGMAIFAFGVNSSTGSIIAGTQENQTSGEKIISAERVVPATATYLFVNKDIINNIYVGVKSKTELTEFQRVNKINIQRQLSEAIFTPKSMVSAGRYLDSSRSFVFTSKYDFVKYPVKEGETILISGMIDAVPMMNYAFGTSELTSSIDTGTQINHATSGEKIINAEIPVPTGMRWLFLNKEVTKDLYVGVKASSVNPKTILTPIVDLDATRHLNTSGVLTTSTGTTATLKFNRWLAVSGRKYTIKGIINAPATMLLYAFGGSQATGDLISQTIVTIDSGLQKIDLEFEVPEHFPYIFINNDTSYGALTVTENLKSAQSVIDDKFSAIESDALNNRMMTTKSIVHHNSSQIPENAMQLYANSLKCTDEFKDFLVELNVSPYDAPFTHTPCMDIADDGYVYAVYMINTVNNDEEPNILRLHKFHVSTPTVVERWDIFTKGQTYNGLLITSFVFDANMKVIGDKIYINCSMKFTGTPDIVACRPFNISTSTFDDVYILNYVFQGTTYQLNNTNINATLKQYGIEPLGGYQAIQPNYSKRVEGGTDWWYCGLGSVQWFQGAILKTSDFINYHFVATPDLKEVLGNYETGVYVMGDYVWMVIRQVYGRNTVVLTRYSILNDEFDQTIYLEDTTSRCTFMADGTKLYLLVSPVTREEILFLDINKSDLTQSKFVQGVNDYSAFYQMAIKYGSDYYCLYTSSIPPNIKNQVRFCKFSMQSITKDTVNTAFKTLLGI